MTINLKQKILAIFFFFTLVIIAVSAFVYHSLLVKDIREMSQAHITSAFEMMFDGFRTHAEQAAPRLERFLHESVVPPLHVLYERLERYTAEDAALMPIWDHADLQTWMYIQGYVRRMEELIENLRIFVPALDIRDVQLYDQDKNLIAVYQQITDREILGMYLPRLRGGTFVPMLTEKDIEATTLWQSVQDISGTSLPNGVAPVYSDDIPQSTQAELSVIGQHITIKLTAPVVENTDFKGVCMIHIAISQRDIERYSRFSQTQINLFTGTTLSIGTLSEYETIASDESIEFHHVDVMQGQEIPAIILSPLTVQNQDYYQGRIGFGDTNRGLGIMTANVARKVEQDRGRKLVGLIAGTTLLLVILTTVAAYILSSKITRPLTNITGLMQQIAEGDLTGIMRDKAYLEHRSRLRTTFSGKPPVNDEIGKLSESFYAMSGYLLEIAELAENISLGEIAQRIDPRSPRDVLGNAFEQMVEYLQEIATITTTIAKGDLTSYIMPRSDLDTFGHTMLTMTNGLQLLITQIRTSAEQIAATGTTIAALTTEEMHLVQNVQESVADMVTTMNQMKSSVDDVAQNMELLAAAVEETFESVSGTTTSMSDISSNTRDLAQKMQSMITDLNHALNVLEEMTIKTNTSRELSQETIQDALEGQQAVEQVRESMDMIQQTNRDAEETITRFAHRSKEIDTILDVIYGVTEQSALLALNASIIAAQAGSHGRGFSVIAEEMRNLADEVGASTKNIAAIVRTLQQDTHAVVSMIHNGTAKIDEGVSRTQQAQQRLEKIIFSAQRSSDVVAEIVDTLQTHISTSQNMMTTMEHLHGMTTEITSSTNKQRITTMQIRDAVEHISVLASHSHHDTRQQLDGVKLVLGAADTVKNLTDRNLDSSQGINHTTVTELAEQAKILLQAVDSFRL